MRLLLHRFPAAGGLLLFALLGAVALAAPQYFHRNAATLIVTNTADSGPGSLRQALADANNGDTIQFHSTLNGQAITLTTAQLVIDTSVTIDGPGATLLTVKRGSQTPDFRVFNVLPGQTVEFTGLTISGGRIADNGGGILNDHSTLTIANCTISSNTILSSTTVSGGGIYNSGTMTLNGVTVSNNNASYFSGNPPGGGGISNTGTMTIIAGTVQSNVGYWYAGGISNSGMMTITDSTISGNQNSFAGHFGGNGGGIVNGGTMTIQNSTISGNTSFGGDIDGGQAGGISAGPSLQIIHCLITGNHATRSGAGIYGGCTITDSVISNNQSNIQNGAGLFGDGSIITNCTITNNQAFGGNGGGVSGNNSTITNSTITGNSALHGGGIAGSGNIAHTTFSNNSASQGGSALYVTNATELGHTILKAGSSGTTISGSGGGVTSHGYNLSSDNAGGFLTGPGDQINTDPLLGPLQNNGGPTTTQALLPGSPAIDAGNPGFTPPPFYDQRDFGYLRVYNNRIDIGAFEVQPLPTVSPTPTATATGTPTPTPTPTPCLPALTQSSSQAVTTANSASCNNGTTHTDNSYWRAFDMTAYAGGAQYCINSVSFGVEFANTTQPITVRLYTTSNFPTAFPGSLTQIGTTTLNVGSAQNGTVVTTPLVVTVPAGTPQLVMELFTPNGQSGGYRFFVGSNAALETDASYWSAPACGFSTPMTTAAIGFPNMHIVFDVNGTCSCLGPTTPTPSPTATATATATSTATIPPTPTPTATPTPPACTLTEGFENITTLIPNGWATQNNSQAVGPAGWFQGNPYQNFVAQSGSLASCIAANFLDGSGLATISNWLLTPPVTLQNGATFSFWTTTAPVSIVFPNVFPDRLQVRMSTNGTSQDVGSDATSVGDFTTLLLDINPTYTTTGYPTGWTNFVVTLSGIPSPVQGRLAFRYFVENGGPSGANSNHIGIDTVAYYCNGIVPTPTPASPTPTPSVTPTPGTPVSSIAGTILFCANPLPNVRINVTGAVTRSELSDSSGNYWFRFLPYARDFTVTPSRAPLAPGTAGIGTTDVLAVQRHYLNILLIPPGCRLMAADVNADTRVNTVDVAAVQRFFLGLTTGIANVGTYQFTPPSRTYTGNGTNWTGHDYDTVLIGDVVAPFVP